MWEPPFETHDALPSGTTGVFRVTQHELSLPGTRERAREFAREGMYRQLARTLRPEVIYTLRFRETEYSAPDPNPYRGPPIVEFRCQALLGQASYMEMRVYRLPPIEQVPEEGDVTWGGVWTAIKRLWNRESFKW